MQAIDILILGAEWTSSFLIPLFHECHLSFAATSHHGSNLTIKFEFHPDSDNLKLFEALPTASTVLITFPIEKKGTSEWLVRLYTQSRSCQESEQGDLVNGDNRIKVQFIQLGATSICNNTNNVSCVCTFFFCVFIYLPTLKTKNLH